MTTKSLATQAQPVRPVYEGKKLVERIAARFNIDDGKMLDTLKATAFKQRAGKNGAAAPVVTNEHMMALLVIAEQYHLNPFTREIYAFPSEGGIVPIIPIDGWLRIMNEHPQFDSLEIALAPDGTDAADAWCECTITRKDRSKPVTIREYLSECKRNTDPWNEMPKRMLRHKAIIQCARVAFGFAGVFDPDEGERIFAAAIDVTPKKPATAKPQALSESDAFISAEQHIKIMDKLKVSEVPASMLRAHFLINDIYHLPASDFDAALAFIDKEFANVS